MMHLQNAVLSAEDLAQYRPRLLQFARRRIGDPALAEDAVQDALVAAMEGISAFAARSAPRTWLTGILKHKIVDRVRRERRAHGCEVDQDGRTAGIRAARLESDETPAEAGLPASWGDPETVLAERRFLDTLERCVQNLPGKAGRVFELREVLGMNTLETCEALDISPTNCCVLLHRARALLRERLSGYRLTGAESP